eukprot:3321745-Amphidinium_carterae.1
MRTQTRASNRILNSEGQLKLQKSERDLSRLFQAGLRFTSVCPSVCVRQSVPIFPASNTKLL